MKKLVNKLSRLSFNRDLGLLIIRIAAGLVFFIHGYEKLQNIDGTIRLIELLGLGGAEVAYGIAWLEVLGGLAFILGIATRVFGVLFGVEMAVAVISIGNAYGFHGYEFPMLLSLISFGLALAGSGRFSVFKMECDQCGGMMCKGVAGECSAR